jgi:DNA helicase II / ATP-dependent DNA helicase PcrA
MYQALNDMNTEQLEAIHAENGNLLIHAGAGTGKTTTIAARILFLQIEKGVSPHKIKALSFSNSAKESLSSKIQYFIKLFGQGSDIDIFTFHSFAFHIILLAIREGVHFRKYTPKILSNPLEFFYEANERIINYEDCEIYLRAIHYLQQGKNEEKIVIKVYQECPIDGDYKITGISGENIYIPYKKIHLYWSNYQKKLRQKNSIDFSTIITEVITILTQPNSTILEFLSRSIDYLIVDEYQDTSVAQEELLLLLASTKKISINAVGDSRQTIYSFNGSTVDNILTFENKISNLDLPLLPSIELKKNYRSGKHILDLANHAMNFSAIHTSNLIQAENYRNTEKEQTFLVKTPDFSLAKKFIIKEISILFSNGIEPREVAILVRKNSTYYPHANEIADLLKEKNIPFQMNLKQDISKIECYEKLAEICGFYSDLTFNQLVNLIKEDKKLIEIAQQRNKILEIILQLQSPNVETSYDVLLLISELLDYPDSIEDDENKIFINTIHSVKGLEFPYVFLLYLGDRSFPHGKYPDIEEERRILHVGITRAMKRLYILGKPGVINHSLWDECCHKQCVMKEFFSENEEEKVNIDEKLSQIFHEGRQKMKEEETKIPTDFDSLWDD